MENSAYRGCSVSLSAADRCCSVLARHRLDEKEEEEVKKKTRSVNRKRKSKMERSDGDGLRSSFQPEIHDEGCCRCC